MALPSSTIVDLSRLDPPTIVEQVDFQTIFNRKLAKVRELLPGFDATVLSDPAVKVLQVSAYDEMLLRQDFNERLVSRLVAYATGSTLDHIGAGLGLARLTVATATGTAPAVMESDDAFRARIVLGPEGFAAAGPELAYVKRAKDAGAAVLDASAITPAPGEVLVSILSAEGDGTASAALLAAVRAIILDPTVRPLGAAVTIASAVQRPFVVIAQIWTFAGPDPSLVMANARAKLDTYLAKSRRLGRDITLSSVIAALTVEGVQRVAIDAPTADIVCDRTQAARCTAITLNHAGYDD